MKKIILTALVLISAFATWAQTRADVFNDETPITFLGFDFSQAKFIGHASSFKDAGEVSNSEMKDKYIPGWEDLVNVDGKDYYRVADAVHRSDVKFAVDVTEKMNKKIAGKNFFSDDMKDYPSLSESTIAAQVKKYDFAGNTGIGMIIFVEGMHKAEDKGGDSYATVWITFVDMKSKKVLFTAKEQGKPGGFGFKNYWAGAWKNVLKAAKSDWKNWKKQ
jgi:hypothetical protein